MPCRHAAMPPASRQTHQPPASRQTHQPAPSPASPALPRCPLLPPAPFDHQGGECFLRELLVGAKSPKMGSGWRRSGAPQKPREFMCFFSMVFSRENGCFWALGAKKHQIPAVWCDIWIDRSRVAVPGEGLLGGILGGKWRVFTTQNNVFWPQGLIRASGQAFSRSQGSFRWFFLVKMVVFGFWEPKNIKFLQSGAISGFPNHPMSEALNLRSRSR